MIVPNELINFEANLHKNVFVPVVWSIFRKRSSEKSFRLKNTGYVQIFFAGSLQWIVACTLFLYAIGYGVGSSRRENNEAGSKCLYILYWRNELFSFDVQYSTQIISSFIISDISSFIISDFFCSEILM